MTPLKTSQEYVLEIERLLEQREEHARELETALRRIKENAESWHGPLNGTGHERALAVIATWVAETLEAMRATRFETITVWRHCLRGRTFTGSRTPRPRPRLVFRLRVLVTAYLHSTLRLRIRPRHRRPRNSSATRLRGGRG